MEISSLLMTITFLLYGDYVNCQSDTLFSFYTEVQGRSSIVEGADVVFICQVNLNTFNDFTDSLFITRVTASGKSIQIATETDVNDETKSVEWNNHVLTVNIANISRYDGGDYLCFAERAHSSGGNMFLDHLNITVDVLYAASGSPVCTTSPLNDGVIWYHGDEITLRCTSNTGNPVVTLTWSDDRAVAIPDAITQIELGLPDNLKSYVTVTLDLMHDGVTFTCLRNNPSFLSNQQLCNIGPLTVEEERPTTLAQTISLATSTIVPPTTGSFNTAINMKSKPSGSTDGIGIIAAIVVVFIIVIGIVIIIVISLVKSGRCAYILKSNKDDSRTENISLEAGHNNGIVAIQDHSHDNPAVDANHILSPNGGQLYAVVQKNTPARESSASGDTSIVYPTAPEYPRPEKTRQSDGDLYANAGIVRDDEASGESHDNPSSNSAARKDTAGISSEKSNVGAASGMNLYADPSEIASGEPADASLIGTTRKQDDSRTENISLEAGHNNGQVAIQDHSHDNPAVDANHVLSPNGGQLYAVVQKNTPARESSASGDTSKVYPTAPEYPRPEKTLQSDGDLYANAGIAHEASGESPDNPSSNSATRKEDTAGISSDKSNDEDVSGMAVYANPSDIVTGDSADASLIGSTRKQDDPEMALYANASEVIPDNSHMPAPSEAPPAPPTMAHTPGLEYADIDIARPASLGADGRVDIISNEDQVLYASVK